MREILLLLSLFCVGFQSSDVLRSVNGTASKCKHFSRLPPKSVARQEALWQDTLREGSVRALCQGREYNSSGLTCHLKEAVRARNSIENTRPICATSLPAVPCLEPHKSDPFGDGLAAYRAFALQLGYFRAPSNLLVIPL